MTVLVESVYAEALRWLYALSAARWTAALMEAALLLLIASLLLAAWRLGAAVGTRIDRAVQASEEEAVPANGRGVRPGGVGVRISIDVADAKQAPERIREVERLPA